SQGLGGGEARANVRNDLIHGTVLGQRVVATADFGATWHITDKWSFLDSFHFSNFHNPIEFDSSECSFFSANLLTGARIFTPVAAVPLNCVSPADGVAGDPHTSPPPPPAPTPTPTP